MSQRSRFTSVILAVVCLIVLAMPVHSATLSGRVIDMSGGEPLLGATVSVREIGSAHVLTGAVTDENGEYKIDGIDEGSYSVSVTYIGYTAQKFSYSPVNGANEGRINAELSPSAMNLSGISVTASRRQEKVLDAPAAVNVISSEQIAARTTLSPTEHLDGLPGIDVAHTGLNQTNVVVRGFNNIFSGALLVLTDNRIARVPSLRFNAHNFISTCNEDIERIEVVSGPGSALYGPNAASGVVHIVTKSPFGSEGTQVSLGGGQRDLKLGSFRHAGTVNGRFGYKITGQFYEGTDWWSEDSREPIRTQLYRPTSDGKVFVGDSIDNARNFDTKKMAFEGRMDWLMDDDMTLIVNGGYNRSSSIELTGLGAGQAIDWSYKYAQARWRYKDLFVQGFVNMSDAGDTYLLKTGQLIIDKSKLWVAQVQHSYAPSDRLSLTYGVDVLKTRPNTDGTINGRNEADDAINESGVYAQGDYKLSNKLKFVGAVRLDDNSRLEEKVFSPRAALVYQPDQNNNFRLTYNRAFSTPDNNSLFLDLLESENPYGTGIDFRVQGVPETGFNWSMGAEGYDYYTAFTGDNPMAYNGEVGSNVGWGVGRTAVMGGLEAGLLGAGTDPGDVAAILGAVGSVVPTTVSGVDNAMLSFDIDTRSFTPADVSDIADISRMKPTITQTFELGYKGIINEKWQFSIDGYYTKKKNFIGPLTIETPNVFLDPTTLAASLTGDIAANYAGADAGTQALLNQLDLVVMGGNGNGSPVDELITMFTSGAAQVPYGTISPSGAFDPAAVLITYRNFGDISFYGADLSFAYHLNQSWNVGGTYSYVSKNFFAKSATQVHDINLNAPRHKIGGFVQYSSPKYGLDVMSRLRFVDAFDMDSPFLGTTVESFTVVDLNVVLDIWQNTSFSLTVQNIFDNKHIEFVGAPELGRLAIGRVTQSF